jgi:hypothetical protein
MLSILSFLRLEMDFSGERISWKDTIHRKVKTATRKTSRGTSGRKDAGSFKANGV